MEEEKREKRLLKDIKTFKEDQEYKFNPKDIKVFGPKFNEAQQIDPISYLTFQLINQLSLMKIY